MSKKISIFVLVCIASNLAIGKEGKICLLLPEQQKIVLENLATAITELQDENISYDIARALTQEGMLYKRENRCWAYLYPVALKEGYAVLDGDGGIYVNHETLETEEVFCFRY